MVHYRLSFVLAVLMLSAGPTWAQPLGTAFSYQGELQSGGQPVTGVHDLEFRLFNAAAGGTQQGATLCADNVAVTNGRFTVRLDFGGQFSGQARFLEIRVRADTGLSCGNATGYTLLSPRQEATPAPNAVFASNAATAATATTAGDAATLAGQSPAFYTNASNLTAGTLAGARLAGTYSGAVSFSNAGNTFTGAGAGLTGLNASNIAAGTLGDARLSTNVPLLGATQTFTGANTFGNALNSFTGSGAGLTNLDASDLASGTVPSARLAGTYSSALTFSNAANSYSGVGTNLTSLNAANISTGTLSDARLSGNIPRLASANAFTGGNIFSGQNDFTSTTEFVFGGRTLQVRNDDGLVPALNLTGTSGNLGILRLRNALEIWPDDGLTRSGRLDLRDNTPAVRITLDAGAGSGVFAGDVVVNNSLTNNGTIAGGLRFGETGSGEGIASKRTVGGNRWGLDLYTGNAARLSITNAGNVGIGTQSPGERLTVAGNIAANNLAAVKGVQTFSDSRGAFRGQLIQGDSRDLDFLTVNVPANGMLMIFATATVQIDTTAMVNAKASIELKLDDTGPGGGLLTNTRYTCRSGAHDGGTLSLVWSVPVTGGTSRSFKTALHVYRDYGSGSASGAYWTSTLHAMFIPNALP